MAETKVCLLRAAKGWEEFSNMVEKECRRGLRHASLKWMGLREPEDQYDMDKSKASLCERCREIGWQDTTLQWLRKPAGDWWCFLALVSP